MPLSEIVECPAGDGALRVLATFVDQSGRSRIHLGCCPACGHVTYIDRPTAQWMDSYYLESWDGHDVEDPSSSRERKLETSRKREKTVVTLANELDVDIRSLRRRYTTTDQSPFEIQFNGPVSLFSK